MKNFFKKPLIMLLLGLIAGWVITRFAFAYKWPIISTAVAAEENCNECYNPPSGTIPGAIAMSAKQAQTGIQAFSSLTKALRQQAIDSSGNSLWTIANTGGYLSKDLLRTLLGSLSAKEDKVGFYYGIQPGSNLLSIYFGTGSADCPTSVPDVSVGENVDYIGNFDVIVGPVDTSTSCPPNCPDFGYPIDQPLPGPGPLPVPTPPDSAND